MLHTDGFIRYTYKFDGHKSYICYEEENYESVTEKIKIITGQNHLLEKNISELKKIKELILPEKLVINENLNFSENFKENSFENDIIELGFDYISIWKIKDEKVLKEAALKVDTVLNRLEELGFITHFFKSKNVFVKNKKNAYDENNEIDENDETGIDVKITGIEHFAFGGFPETFEDTTETSNLGAATARKRIIFKILAKTDSLYNDFSKDIEASDSEFTELMSDALKKNFMSDDEDYEKFRKLLENENFNNLKNVNVCYCIFPGHKTYHEHSNELKRILYETQDIFHNFINPPIREAYIISVPKSQSSSIVSTYTQYDKNFRFEIPSGVFLSYRQSVLNLNELISSTLNDDKNAIQFVCLIEQDSNCISINDEILRTLIDELINICKNKPKRIGIIYLSEKEKNDYPQSQLRRYLLNKSGSLKDISLIVEGMNKNKVIREIKAKNCVKI